MANSIQLRGTLRGHSGWVTQIAINQTNPNMIVSGSRDKTLIVWDLTRRVPNYGVPRIRLHGHSHFVSDVVLSPDGNYALSGSWDKTLRLWDLATGHTTCRFEGHDKDVLSVDISSDNRRIVSGGRDNSIKLWSTVDECERTIGVRNSLGTIFIGNTHSDWVSCVRFSPNPNIPVIVSVSWDKTVKIWNFANHCLTATIKKHRGYINTVAVSRDGSLCASGGKDWNVNLFDINDGQNLYSFGHSGLVEAVCFSPSRYWLCVAGGPSIVIWDLETKERIDELCPEIVTLSLNGIVEPINCLSLAWSSDGQTLFAGYSDNAIRVWKVGVNIH